MSPESWKQMKSLENGDFDLALDLDAEIRTKDPNVYLHPSGLPLGEGVEQTERQSDMFDGCDSGYCLT
jgi:hypothetical protein